MRAALFANGNLEVPQLSLKKAELIIAADGGARHCMQLGIQPDYVVGDFDSLETGELEALRDQGTRLIRFPARKDFTDLELALQQITRLKQDEGLHIEEVTIYGALGSRWDQTIANLLLASTFTTAPILIVHGNQEIRFLKGSERLIIGGSIGDTVSLIPLGEIAAGIFTQGLEYPLHNENLIFGSTREISNVLANHPASITLENGMLAVMVIHHSLTTNLEGVYEI